MPDAATVTKLTHAAKKYTKEVSVLAAAGSTTEATYYPAIRALITAALETENLPFDVRINTSERREEGGIDLPDVALYDAAGKFLVVCGEVKLPNEELDVIAASTEGNNQIGRYLASTRAVITCNVRGFGLVTVKGDWMGKGPVPPHARRIEQIVELWPSVSSLKQGKPISAESLDRFAALIETAATRYAPIAEPQSLARILARQAKAAKTELPEKFTQAVQGLLDDFGKALGVNFIGDEGEEFFRSSLIQTSFYGLFAAWALWWQSDKTKPFRWEDIGDYLKIPFLGSLFHEFRHPARIKELQLAKHLDIATETLSRVDGNLFFSKFKLPTLEHEKEDAATAIMYFYEPFLEAFDPNLRKELGVWYTPASIVRYQVGKIDRLLREELDCDRGFADEKVIVLDPCCGTGAYLIEALRYAAIQLEAEGVGAALAAKLLDAVCRRFIGFEILTAPFVVAQLQLYMLLARLGAAPDEGHRPAVFLTNALAGWNGTDQLKLNFPELQEEHDAARDVKRESKIIVVLGNPPYNRFAGVPLEEEADLVDYYKGIKRDEKGKQIGQTLLFSKWGVRKHLLDDLYIRFFRLADIRIGEKAEFGIVSFISNSSYLSGRSHPIMRESLVHNFDEVWIDNLHGNRIASERTPWGESCETIFSTEEIGPGIKVGTCISTFLKRRSLQTRPAKVRIRDFWGRAEKKRSALLSSVDMDSWPAPKQKAAAQSPQGPRAYEEFPPSQKSAWKFAPYRESGFESWPGLDDLFPKSLQGVNPNRGLDGSVMDTDADALETRMRHYFSSMSFDEFQARYPAICKPRARYVPKTVRARLRNISAFDKKKLIPYLLFPLDVRWIYYETESKFLNEARPELSTHIGNNEFLVGVPQARRVSESRPLIVPGLFDLHLHDWGSVGFPMQVNPDEGIGDLFKPDPKDLVPLANISETIWSVLKVAWRIGGDLHGTGAKRLCRALFRYAMAISHSPQYAHDHKDSLAQSWPHVPIYRDNRKFIETAEVGDQLAQLLNPLKDPAAILKALLGKDAKALAVIQRTGGGGNIKESELKIEYSYFGAGQGKYVERAPEDPEVLRPEWGEVTGDLYLNETVFLRNVPQGIWQYELGGYPVLKKWLGYRHIERRDGGALTLGEMDHLRGIIHRIAAVLMLYPLLDSLYEGAASEPWSLEELKN